VVTGPRADSHFSSFLPILPLRCPLVIVGAHGGPCSLYLQFLLAVLCMLTSNISVSPQVALLEFNFTSTQNYQNLSQHCKILFCIALMHVSRIDARIGLTRSPTYPRYPKNGSSEYPSIYQKALVIAQLEHMNTLLQTNGWSRLQNKSSKIARGSSREPDESSSARCGDRKAVETTGSPCFLFFFFIIQTK